MFTISNEAKADLDEIWLYIAQDDPEAADGVIDHLESQFHTLAQSPKMGRIRDDLWPNALCFNTGKGSWRSRFLIFYRITSEGIEIARIRGGHQDINPDHFS